MANARCEMQILRRSAGRSVVAAAAYRSGERLDDERTGEVHDYERRGGVTHSEIITPADAPEWATDRGRLWNHVEAIEKHPAAQVARELLVCIPHELSEDDRRGCVLDYAQHIADTYGFVVDAAIHVPGREGDNRNHHAHLLFSNRPVDGDSATGLGNKDRRFDNIAMQRSGEDNEVEDLRHQWQEICNAALTRADIRDERGELVQVDLRSYERQGVDRETTEHEGPEATQIRRQGGQTDVGQANDEVRERNAEREQLEQQIEGGYEAIAEELQAIHRTPDEDRIKFALHDSEPVQAIFADLDDLPRGRPTYAGGRFSKEYSTAEYQERVSEFNQWLAAPDREDIGGDGGQAARQPEPLDTDPQSDVDPPPAQPWRWRGLDALNRELGEPVEDERKKERGEGDQRHDHAHEVLDTDPEPEEPERQRGGPGWSFGRGL